MEGVAKNLEKDLRNVGEEKDENENKEDENVEKSKEDENVEKSKEDENVEKGKEDENVEKSKEDENVEKSKEDENVEKSKEDENVEKSKEDENVEKSKEDENVEKSKEDENVEKSKEDENVEREEKIAGEENEDWIAGYCKWFNFNKGWGFLNISDSSENAGEKKKEENYELCGRKKNETKFVRKKMKIRSKSSQASQDKEAIQSSKPSQTNQESQDDKPYQSSDPSQLTQASQNRKISNINPLVLNTSQDLNSSTDIFVHQSVIAGAGWRCLKPGEQVDFKIRKSERGWEATAVRGSDGIVLAGKRPLPKGRRLRCFNCGDVTRHLAVDCPKPPLPKRCHNCKSEFHLIEDCPALPQDQKIKKNTHISEEEEKEEEEEGKKEGDEEEEDKGP